MNTIIGAILGGIIAFMLLDFFPVPYGMNSVMIGGYSWIYYRNWMFNRRLYRF
jgi:hypothetical protein